MTTWTRRTEAPLMVAAVGLMLAGIAVIGSVTGMMASWMVEQVRVDTHTDRGDAS